MGTHDADRKPPTFRALVVALAVDLASAVRTTALAAFYRPLPLPPKNRVNILQCRFDQRRNPDELLSRTTPRTTIRPFRKHVVALRTEHCIRQGKRFEGVDAVLKIGKHLVGVPVVVLSELKEAAHGFSPETS